MLSGVSSGIWMTLIEYHYSTTDEVRTLDDTLGLSCIALPIFA